MLLFLILIFVFVAAAYIFLQQPQFGKQPSGARLERIKKSPHFRDGQFRNLSPTPDLTEGATVVGVLLEFIFSNRKRIKPTDAIPSVKTNLATLPTDGDVLVWFGHSSYFIQADGKKILTDPVFSGAASPLTFTTRAFRGSDCTTAGELPEIDYLFLTHDHWDHLDYETLLKIKHRVKKVICPLGVGAHLDRWGYPKEIIAENDWNETVMLGDGFATTLVPARHFSGRGLKRKNTLWTSYVLNTPTSKIFLGGDSGYDFHFKKIGDEHGPFDLAILENGQYDKSWKYIHLMPEEVIQAALDLQAKQLLPVHFAKFAIANHAWDDPLKRVTEAGQHAPLKLLTPMIGEAVDFKNPPQEFAKWWEGIN